jgi:hypothetical protein
MSSGARGTDASRFAASAHGRVASEPKTEDRPPTAAPSSQNLNLLQDEPHGGIRGVHGGGSVVRHARFVLTVLVSLAVACETKKEPSPPTPTVTSATASATASASAAGAGAQPSGKLDEVPREAFNRIAAELMMPIFWIEDRNANKVLEPEELAFLFGFGDVTMESELRKGAGFSEKFFAMYAQIAQRHKEGPPKVDDPKEQARRAAVLQELAQGRPTLVASDFSKGTEDDRKLVAHVLRAAEAIERLYAKQMGTFELRTSVPSDDRASRMLFYRNQGPKCQAPKTKDVPECGALPQMPQGKLSGLYSKDILAKDKFCEALTKNKKVKGVMDPFTVVQGTLEDPKPVPYSEAFKADMDAVSLELKAAADDLTNPAESALKAYLLAASQAFKDNSWVPADEAWAKMSVNNSKWYLRIAPDEVYEEPCSTKALFHVSFGRINTASLKWQSKLDPLKTEMEAEIAQLAGPPYAARKVTFKLPDFVDIVLNAGDSRNPSGATIGQSLPNFGPVANEGRGRTVAMTNFYTDTDSLEAAKQQAESLFCKTTMATYTSDPEPMLMSTVLHEAAHNLGPAHQYKVGGKIDREAFGGPLASTLEELKAQTSAMYFTDWLVGKTIVDKDTARRAHVKDVFWAFGHVSRGMYTGDGHPLSYSQLAAMQIGYFLDKGGMAWKAEETAANGKDTGCFEIDLDKLPGVVKSFEQLVAGIKARGDKAAGDKLVRDYVDVSAPRASGAGDKRDAGAPAAKPGDAAAAASDAGATERPRLAKVHEVITERMLRAPKPSFVYSIKLD